MFSSGRLSPCTCGCVHRLTIGSHICAEMRRALHTDLGVTSCGGVSHNKLLAKVAGEQNKPNAQTVLFAGQERKLMESLGSVRKVPGKVLSGSSFCIQWNTTHGDIVVTLLWHHCDIIVESLWHHCGIIVTLQNHCGIILMLWPHCDIFVTLWNHCGIIVTSLWHRCDIRSMLAPYK